MEIRRLLAGSPVEIEAVVYADRAEGRHPADATAGRFAQIGQVELRAEAIDVADVEERGESDVERQRDEVLDVGEHLARAADADAELVRGRNLSRLEAADRVRSAEVEAFEDRQLLIAESEAVAALHAPRQDVAEPDGLEVRRERRALHVMTVAAEAGGVGRKHELAALARRLHAVAAIPCDGRRYQRGDLGALFVPQEGILGDSDEVDPVLSQTIAGLPAPVLL